MGYNTTIVLLNDALSSIEGDLNLGKKLRDATLKMSLAGQKPVDVSAGNHCNALLVVETHHADQMVPILVGGNYAHVVDKTYVKWNNDKMEEDLLRQLADKHGYTLRKKSKR